MSGSQSVDIANVAATGWDASPSLVSVGSGNTGNFGVMNTSLKYFDGYTSALRELTFTATLLGGGTWSSSNGVLVNNAAGYFAAAHIFPQDVADTSVAFQTGLAGNGNVPIPPTVLLLGSGLIGLIFLSRKRQRQQASS
ncbi:MAG TPA: hypothetical protein VK254_04755 [Candidatus Bathyarchaeia archaeon]|nr:hypothetical protein [Candidatus Bathyarchaeia archaeon]